MVIAAHGRRYRTPIMPTTADERLFAFSQELFVHANAHRTVFQAMVGKRSGAVVHRRRVVFVKARYWVLVDDVDGTGEHESPLVLLQWSGQ